MRELFSSSTIQPCFEDTFLTRRISHTSLAGWLWLAVRFTYLLSQLFIVKDKHSIFNIFKLPRYLFAAAPSFNENFLIKEGKVQRNMRAIYVEHGVARIYNAVCCERKFTLNKRLLHKRIMLGRSGVLLCVLKNFNRMQWKSKIRENFLYASADSLLCCVQSKRIGFCVSEMYCRILQYIFNIAEFYWFCLCILLKLFILDEQTLNFVNFLSVLVVVDCNNESQDCYMYSWKDLTLREVWIHPH